MHRDYKILDNIQFPQDLKSLSMEELKTLAEDLRWFIIDVVSKNGGHLGASLGTIELTIALHYVFDTPQDYLIWDVGHQAYGHKILTGRKDRFDTNRKKGGISGFPNRQESQYDVLSVGHASTSISAGLGIALANKEQKVICVIGDASIAGGMAFEALNHAGTSDANLLIVLNDNAMSIDPSVGALHKYLSSFSPLEKASFGKSQQKESNFFENLNLNYVGVNDGHNIRVDCCLARHKAHQTPNNFPL